jgi:hypothetical protein
MQEGQMKPLKFSTGMWLLSMVSMGCAATAESRQAWNDDAHGAPVDAIEQALSTPTAFSAAAAYKGYLRGSCSTAYDIAGYEPAEAGTYPVFIYLTGTSMPFNGLDATTLNRAMAQRGFVAATVQYDNTTYPLTCSMMTGKANCVFNANSSTSAVSAICARAKADCSKGIVVSGFSQGANMASLAKNYDSRMHAAYLIGHGGKGASGINLQSCLQDSATAFAPSEGRAVDGDHDQYFGTTPDGVRTQLQIAMGVSCPGAWNCLQADGSGWYMVQPAQLVDGSADHCYFYNGANSTCSTFNGLDSNWANNATAWEMNPDLDWLDSRVTH